MKKIVLFFSILIFFACDNRTPQQKAQDEYNQEKAQMMKHESYIDSLVNVAYGVGGYKYQRENRYNAIEILKKEYPEISSKLDSIKLELYKGNY